MLRGIVIFFLHNVAAITTILQSQSHHNYHLANELHRALKQGSRYEPCSYTRRISTLKINEGKNEEVKIVEKICNNKSNEAKWMGSNYACRQLYDTETIYVDAQNRIIEPVNVNYRFSCELRCVSDRCKRPSKQ